VPVDRSGIYRSCRAQGAQASLLRIAHRGTIHSLAEYVGSLVMMNSELQARDFEQAHGGISSYEQRAAGSRFCPVFFTVRNQECSWRSKVLASNMCARIFMCRSKSIHDAIARDSKTIIHTYGT